MRSAPKRIWALLDERQGNTSQTLGVAEALGMPFETVQIAFNHFIRIPNILINRTTLGINKANSPQFMPPWPDMVISTARRLGLVASYIKFQHPETFIAQIQWPGFPSAYFDLIATPKHDNVTGGNNVLLTVGAPHRVTLDTLAQHAEAWRARIHHLPSPRIAVLVGGDSGSRIFSQTHAEKLAALSSTFANSLGGSLLITTSRRTGATVAANIKGCLSAPHYFYDWHIANGDNNPFYGFLGFADAVIATGDSISMCSEACATGKPVYVYSAPDFVSPKHQTFLDELFKLGLAKPLLENGNHLFVPPFRLDDARDIAQEIRKRVGIII